MRVKLNQGQVDKIVVVRCEPLSDAWECEYDRTLIALIDENTAKDMYSSAEYEWYGVKPHGALYRIKECEL